VIRRGNIWGMSNSQSRDKVMIVEFIIWSKILLTIYRRYSLRKIAEHPQPTPYYRSLRRGERMSKADDRINKLLGNMLSNYDESYGIGSMSCNVYDTAWVASIQRTVAGKTQWLFPSSYVFILDSQLEDGGWPAHPNSVDVDDVDGILSTMAAIFCLQEHASKPLQLGSLNIELLSKILKGVKRLSMLLNQWKVDECDSVGYEVLVPSLLELLEARGLSFNFPGRAELFFIRNQKLKKIRPELLCEGRHFALLHSLEAFHNWGEFDVDKVAHHKIDGSIMASPSATASYLMRCSAWDEEAEAYLRLVISNGHGKNSGGVSSAYPSTNFELIQVSTNNLSIGIL
jgi:hypothetical protein